MSSLIAELIAEKSSLDIIHIDEKKINVALRKELWKIKIPIDKRCNDVLRKRGINRLISIHLSLNNFFQ